MNETRVHPSPARAGHSAQAQPPPCPVPLELWGQGTALVPAPSYSSTYCSQTGRGEMCSSKLPWIFAAVFLAAVFTVKAQRTPGASPCKGLGRLRAAALETGRGLWVAFFSYESDNCVINSSVTSNHVLVSSALTGANLNVFHLKSKPQKLL